MVSSLSMMNGRKIYFFQKMKCDNQTLMQQLDSFMLGSNETILSQKLLGKQKTDIFISFGLDWICFKSFSKNHVHQQTNCQKRLCSFVYLFSILSWVKLIFFSITQNWISRIVFSFRFALIMISWNEYWVYKACIKFDEKWMSHFVVSFMKKYIKN